MYPFSITRSSKTSFPLLNEASEHFTTPNAAGSVRASPLEAIIGFLFKRSAKHLRTHLARVHGLELTHGQALDAVSAGLGCADWNTANAHLQQLVREDQGGLGQASAQLDAAAAAPVAMVAHPAHETWRQGSLRTLVDFNVCSAVVGAAGSGKSVGMLFALKSQLKAALGRPMMVVHGHEDERYQPNWLGLLRDVPNLQTWDADVPFDMGTPSISEAVQVTVMADASPWTAPDREARQQALAARLLQWLAPRAHLRPLLIVDEAYELFGKHAGQFLTSLPAGVVVIWLTQTIQDLGLSDLAECFDVAHLMSVPRGEQNGEALGLDALQRGQLEQRMKSRTIGQAVSIPLGGVARFVARAVVDTESADLALRQRVMSAIRMALPQLRIHHHTLPRNLRVSAWTSGRQLLVAETHLRDQVQLLLSAEDREAVARVHRPGAPVSGLRLVMLEVLDDAGWLVRQVGTTVLAPDEALWNIIVGKLDYKGVLALQLRGGTPGGLLALDQVGPTPDDLKEGRRVPTVTGALFAEPGEAMKRFRKVMGAPLPES